MKRFGNTTGAFADSALLFPLLAALSLQAGMDGAMLMATAGAAYIAAGVWFRVPMSVQPLKSVAVAALALGASAGEITASGAVVGILCLLLSCCNLDKWAGYVPRHLVHGVQMALGILLMWKAAEWGLGSDAAFLFIGVAALVILVTQRSAWPLMGWLGALGMVAGVVLAFGEPVVAASVASAPLRLDIILALVLPQMALTLSNSVIGTQDAAQRYFGAAASRVTLHRLLRSIGFGNLLVAPLGGLPFCHGAGGITAHAKGGATTWHMNLIIGGSLLALAALSWALSLAVIPAYPPLLMAVLLFATGWFHLLLAAPSWQQPALRWVLVAMALAAIISKHMLWVLCCGIICEGIRRIRRRAAA